MPRIARCWPAICWQFGAVTAFCLVTFAGGQEPPASEPLSPQEALAKFQLADPNLKIELAAAEPEVVDPVAIRFDEQGRMWVAEMRDYPLGPPDGGPPLSRIKILTDVDANGTFDKTTVFAERIPFVTGLQPWRGGVIVTLAGKIMWMKDTTGDDQVDVAETWYTGFAEQNSQLRANHPRLALDNHVYVANGLRGGVVVNHRLPNEPPINLQGRDFRFDPLTGKAEAISGNGQFGMCFDDWGNRFTCTNRNPVIHVVLEDRYLKMAPKIPITAVVQDVAAAGEKSKVFPISRAWTTSNLHAGTFTAACGVHVYRDEALSEVFGNNSVFTCDPTGNFVHLEKFEEDGSSFTSKPAYEGKEFLASTDEWFRPVNVETGPDGCLYIVDMYRCVIEHPDFVPDELKKRPDLRLGDDRGRIWRIGINWLEFFKNNKESRALRSFQHSEEQLARLRNESAIIHTLPTERLVTRLRSKNVWQRETAHRLLLEQADPKTPAAIRASLLEDPAMSKQPLQYYAHALWLMHGLGQLNRNDFSLYADNAPRPVLRQTLLVAEEMLRNKTLEPRDLVFPKSWDASVNFQKLLLDLSRQDDLLEDAIDPHLLPQEQNQHFDRWQEAALLLRHHRQLLAVYRATVAQEKQPEHFQKELVKLIGSRGTDQEAMLLLKASKKFSEEKLVIIVDELARGLLQRNRQPGDVLQELQRHDGTNWIRFYTNLCSGMVLENDRPLEVRLAAARLLGVLPEATPRLTTLINESTFLPLDLQSILVTSLAARGSESVGPWKLLLSSYEAQSLPIKRSLIDSSFRRSDGPALLLEQVKAGVIQPAEIDPLRRKQLLENKDAAIKKSAEELFAALNPANRQQALDDYQPVLKLKANAKKGALVFEKNCSTCHRVGEIGVNVAPDISDTRTKTAAQLLADIIQPNRAIDSNFIGYQLLLKDGTATSGLLAAETSTSLTLKQPGGKVVTIARDEVELLKATGVSLMPDGLEKNIPPEAMADLLAYLKNWRYLDGKTPLGP